VTYQSFAWGDVGLKFESYDGLTNLDFHAGLQRLELTMTHQSGRATTTVNKYYTEIAATNGYLPVVRQHKKFEQAGLITRLLLLFSQGLCVLLLIVTGTTLLFRRTAPPMVLCAGMAVLEGLCGAAGSALWALLVPSVGVGHLYSFSMGWAFKSTLAISSCHVLVTTAAWLRYSQHTSVPPGSSQHTQFEKLPMGEDQMGNFAPAPNTITVEL